MHFFFRGASRDARRDNRATRTAEIEKTEQHEAVTCYKVLREGISDRVLADAAFSVKAYARAAMYLER